MSSTAFPRPWPTLDTILVRHTGLEVTLLVARGTAVTPSPAATCGQRFHSEVVGVQSGTVELLLTSVLEVCLFTEHFEILFSK